MRLARKDHETISSLLDALELNMPLLPFFQALKLLHRVFCRVANLCLLLRNDVVEDQFKQFLWQPPKKIRCHK